jgi:tRNA(fMet)-specific endonuclease VapC
MSLRYLLDTNTVSHILKRQPAVLQRLVTVPIHAIGISAITAGELFYGLSKRPDATNLHLLVHEFLQRVTILPWDHAVAQTYGKLRAQLQSNGITLSPLDMQIAAHAHHIQAILVSSDQAFQQVPHLATENWA